MARLAVAAFLFHRLFHKDAVTVAGVFQAFQKRIARIGKLFFDLVDQIFERIEIYLLLGQSVVVQHGGKNALPKLPVHSTVAR